MFLKNLEKNIISRLNTYGSSTQLRLRRRLISCSILILNLLHTLSHTNIRAYRNSIVFFLQLYLNVQNDLRIEIFKWNKVNISEGKTSKIPKRTTTKLALLLIEQPKTFHRLSSIFRGIS